MRFLDVGVLLCVALKEPEEHFEGCRALLERLKGGDGRPRETVATTALTPAVFNLILEGRETPSRGKVTLAMKALRSLNIKFFPLKDGALMEEAAVVAERYGVGFDVALNALVMRDNGIKEIYALDKGYDWLEWVKRIVPTVG